MGCIGGRPGVLDRARHRPDSRVICSCRGHPRGHFRSSGRQHPLPLPLPLLRSRHRVSRNPLALLRFARILPNRTLRFLGGEWGWERPPSDRTIYSPGVRTYARTCSGGSGSLAAHASSVIDPCGKASNQPGRRVQAAACDISDGGRGPPCGRRDRATACRRRSRPRWPAPRRCAHGSAVTVELRAGWRDSGREVPGAERRVGTRIFEGDEVEDRNVSRPGERTVAKREVERGEGRGDGDDEPCGPGSSRYSTRTGTRVVPSARSSLPAGITRAEGAGWERPRTQQKGRQEPPVSGPSIRRMEGGRSQPHSPRKRGEWGRG